MYLIQKNGIGVWYMVESVTERQPDGKAKNKKVWRSTKTTDKEKAELILKEVETSRGLLANNDQAGLRDMIVERATATSMVVCSQKYNWDEVWNTYSNDPRTRAMQKRSRERMRSALNQFIAYSTWGDINSVSRADADGYIIHRRGMGVQNTTLILERTALGGIWRRVKRQLGLYENVWEGVYIPCDDKRDHRVFQLHELLALIGGLPSADWKLVVYLGIYTGLRFGDCCTLHCDDVHDGFIRRKNRKGIRYNAESIVAIHPDLAPILQQGMEAVGGKGEILPKFARLYLRRDKNFRLEFGKILRNLGLKKDDDRDILDFHSLRHTFNTWLIDEGVDLGVRLRMTGHTNVNTNQIYNHATKGLTNAINKLPSIA